MGYDLVIANRNLFYYNFHFGFFHFLLTIPNTYLSQVNFVLLYVYTVLFYLSLLLWTVGPTYCYYFGSSLVTYFCLQSPWVIGQLPVVSFTYSTKATLIYTHSTLTAIHIQFIILLCTVKK